MNCERALNSDQILPSILVCQGVMSFQKTRPLINHIQLLANSSLLINWLFKNSNDQIQMLTCYLAYKGLGNTGSQKVVLFIVGFKRDETGFKNKQLTQSAKSSEGRQKNPVRGELLEGMSARKYRSFIFNGKDSLSKIPRECSHCKESLGSQSVDL